MSRSRVYVSLARKSEMTPSIHTGLAKDDKKPFTAEPAQVRPRFEILGVKHRSQHTKDFKKGIFCCFAGSSALSGYIEVTRLVNWPGDTHSLLLCGHTMTIIRGYTLRNPIADHNCNSSSATYLPMQWPQYNPQQTHPTHKWRPTLHCLWDQQAMPASSLPCPVRSCVAHPSVISGLRPVWFWTRRLW